MIYKALLFFFLLEYARPGDWVPALSALKVNTVVPLIAAFGTLMGRAPVSASHFFSETNTRFMGVLLGLMAVSSLFATVSANAADTTKNVFGYVLVYMVLARQLGDVDRIKGVLKTLILVHVLLIGLNPGMLLSADRASVPNSTFLGDGNDFALSLNVCIPLCLFLMMDASKKMARLFWAAVVLVFVMGIVVTQSRGGTIGLVAVGLYYWSKSRRKVLTTAMAMGAVILVLAAAPAGYFERIRTTTDTEEGSAQGRITAWKAAGSMALSNPLLGEGPGNFAIAHGRLVDGRWVTAHSIYFLLLGELGFSGLIWLLALISFNLAANSRLQRQLKNHHSPRASTMASLLSCTSVSLVGFSIAGAFLSATYYPHLYVICGLLAATRYVAARELAAEAPPGTVALVPAVITPDAISPQWQPQPIGIHGTSR